MDPALQKYLIAGAMVALCVLLGLFRRRASVGAFVLLVCLIGMAGLGAFSKGDPLGAFPLIGVARLFAALAMGALARAAGGPRLPVHRALAAIVAGALLGGLSGAALVATLETDRSRASRLALAAAAGGLLSPVGAPAVLLLDAWPLLVAPALAMAAVSLPGRRLVEDKPVLPGNGLVSLVLLLVGVGAAFSPEPLWPMGVGCAVLGFLARREFGALPRLVSFASVVWLLAAGALVGLTRASGLFWEARAGAEYLLGRDDGVRFGFFLVAAVVAMVGGELLAAMLVAGLLQSWPEGAPVALALPIIAGVAAGGPDAIFVSGGLLSAGFARYLLRLLVVLAWVALVV